MPSATPSRVSDLRFCHGQSGCLPQDLGWRAASGSCFPGPISLSQPIQTAPSRVARHTASSERAISSPGLPRSCISGRASNSRTRSPQSYVFDAWIAITGVQFAQHLSAVSSCSQSMRRSACRIARMRAAATDSESQSVGRLWFECAVTHSVRWPRTQPTRPLP